MQAKALQQRLEFIQQAEALKDVLRRAYTSQGRQESTAEHTWRLCLLAMVFEDQLTEIDFSRVLKLCVVHDLGEAIHGDIPAVEQDPSVDKAAQERADLQLLLTPLPSAMQQEFLVLWDEYEAAQSMEARVVKALDKLETIIQHNQGKNPADFDYSFNLEYGKQYTDAVPLFALLRELVDQDTRARADQPNTSASD